MCRISTRRSPGRRAAPARRTARSRFARSGPWQVIRETDESLARAAAETAARRSYGKLIAYLAARSRDVAAAEDALADAFASALIDWPKNGIPHNPEAWLLTAARRRSIDAVRRAKSAALGEGHLTMIAEE